MRRRIAIPIPKKPVKRQRSIVLTVPVEDEASEGDVMRLAGALEAAVVDFAARSSRRGVQLPIAVDRCIVAVCPDWSVELGLVHVVDLH